VTYSECGRLISNEARALELMCMIQAELLLNPILSLQLPRESSLIPVVSPNTSTVKPFLHI
jgi:hypothetical protein